MKSLVANKMLGRKTGKGFYLYPKDAKKGAKKQVNPEFLAIMKGINGGKVVEVSPEDIQGRMMTRFVNETVFCLQDGIIRAPADGTSHTSIQKHSITISYYHHFFVWKKNKFLHFFEYSLITNLYCMLQAISELYLE
jgi:hypothetical protein